MILQKVLAAGRSAAVSKIVAPSTDMMTIAKRTKIVASPPTQKMSTAEKVIFGITISSGIVAVPIWVVCHLQEYGSE